MMPRDTVDWKIHMAAILDLGTFTGSFEQNGHVYAYIAWRWYLRWAPTSLSAWNLYHESMIETLRLEPYSI